MWWMRHLLFAPDAPAGAAATEPAAPEPDIVEEERQRTMATADEYLKSANIGDDRPRDPETGRFLPKTAESTGDGGVAGTDVEAPTIDPVWVERAKMRGFTDDQISEFKTESDVETALIRDTITAARKFGTDPMTISQALRFYQQHNGQPPQDQRPPQPAQAQAAPPATVALPEFKLALPEDIVDPQVGKALQESLTQYAAQLKASFEAELHKRDQKLEAWETERKQSAEAREQVAQAEANAAMFDRAASQVPGMVEFFGKPSELDRIARQNPSDPKVKQFRALAPYLEDKIQFWAGELGWNERAMARAFQDALQESPFAQSVAQARSGSRNGNGTAAYGNGSVVRSPGRTRPRSESLPPDGDIEAEAKRIMAELESMQWEPGQTVGAAHGPV